MAGKAPAPMMPDARPEQAEERADDEMNALGAAAQGGFGGGFGGAKDAKGAAGPLAPPAVPAPPPPFDAPGQPLAAMAPVGGPAANKPGAHPPAAMPPAADDKMGFEKKADADVALRDGVAEEGKQQFFGRAATRTRSSCGLTTRRSGRPMTSPAA